MLAFSSDTVCRISSSPILNVICTHSVVWIYQFLQSCPYFWIFKFCTIKESCVINNPVVDFLILFVHFMSFP